MSRYRSRQGGAARQPATVYLDARAAQRVESAHDIVILTTNGEAPDDSSTLDIIDAAGEHRGHLCVSMQDGWLSDMEVFSAGATITEIPHPGELYLADGRSLIESGSQPRSAAG